MSARHWVVSGTRSDLTPHDEALIQAILSEEGLEDSEPQDTLHVGDCKTGVDAYIKQLASGWPLYYREHKARWTEHGKAAGPIRNREMLDAEPYRLVRAYAFPRVGLRNKGTRDFIQACMAREVDFLVTWLPRSNT